MAALGIAPVEAGELTIESGPGRAGNLVWQGLAWHYRMARDQPEPWELDIEQLALGDALIADRVALDCARGRAGAAGVQCSQGRLALTGPAGEWQWNGEVSIESRSGGGLVARVAGNGMDATFHAPTADRPFSVQAELHGLGLDMLPAAWLEPLGLSELDGRVTGRLNIDPASVELKLTLDQGGFDSTDGTLAGAGLVLALDARVALGGDARTFEARLRQHGGELLLGPVYLPPPDAPLEVGVAGRLAGTDRLDIERLTLSDPGALEITASAWIGRTGEEWALQRFDLERLVATLPKAWRRWADGPAAAAGLGELDTAGRLEGGLVWRDGAIESLVLEASALDADDPAGRFAIESLDADVRLAPGSVDAAIDWQALELWKLPLGTSRLRLAGDRRRLALAEPLVMPLIDGAVVLEELEWLKDGEESALVLDARIEPLDLSDLTQLLGFPEFGGELSGRFPGVVYVDERLSFTGGIDVQAFSGHIEMTELSVERPFGTLPALAAQVEFERLDLAELTGAFDFGHMEGELSGWMRDLRLLDWQPVAMDARLYTHEDAPRRRISQRAVENLSTLGGAGGALITGTILRVFEEFPYRRAGLACRLGNNICHLDGVAPHESGGFYIVEGRALPRLDVIGHRRLVNWPQLLTQLASMVNREPVSSE